MAEAIGPGSMVECVSEVQNHCWILGGLQEFCLTKGAWYRVRHITEARGRCPIDDCGPVGIALHDKSTDYEGGTAYALYCPNTLKPLGGDTSLVKDEIVTKDLINA